MPKPRVITEQEDFPVKPSDINAAEHMWEAFGNTETDVSAGYIVRLMQEKGDWVPFTYGELNAFYQKTCKPSGGGYIENYIFNHLIGPFEQYNARELWTEHLDVVVPEREHTGRYEDGDVFRVTDEFVFRCYRSAAIPRMKPASQPVG